MGRYIWYSDEGTGWGRSPPRPLLAVPNVTSTASVPITVLLNVLTEVFTEVWYGIVGFNVPLDTI